MGLTKAAISRPVFVFMLMIAAFLLGTISYKTMRLELNPDVSFGVVTVTTTYQGADPDTINQLVSKPIEEAVSGVSGLREVTSTSLEGISTVVVSLNIGVNQDVALSDVRSKVDTVVKQLPRLADKPVVSKLDSSSQPMLYMSISSTKLDSRALRDLVDQKLKDKYGQIDGVAEVDVQGGDVREIQVQVKKDKLLAYGIGITDVSKALSGATLNTPAGHAVTSRQEFSVRVKAEFEKFPDIQNMVFTVSDPNKQNSHRSVRLRDVATILDTKQERTTYSRLNGNDNITLVVQKTKEGNAVDITSQADVISGQIQKDYADQGIKIEKTLDTAKQISESLADLNFALFFGVLLVATIVYIFLHNLRGTIIVALAIPTSIFACFIALKLMGFTINNMSMLSLSLAIGVLVDDAIVVLENIYRHLKMGEDPRDAALNGRAEIGLAALAITFADVVVFLPIAFMGGIVGEFFKPLALGFVCATLFSLFVSFTLTPMLASRWYRRGEDVEHPTGRFAVWFEKRFGGLEHRYRVILEWALNHRWFVFISGNLALFAAIMFIAGDSMLAPMKPGGPPMVAMFVVLSVAVAIIAFGINYWKKVLPARVKRIGGLAVAGVSVLVALVMGFRGNFGGAIGALIGISAIVYLALGVIALVANAFNTQARYRMVLFGLAFGMIFPAAAIAGKMFHDYKKESVFKFGFLPDTDAGQVNVSIELPAGSNLAETQKVVERAEKVLMADPDVKYVISSVGSQQGGFGGGGNTGSNFAQVTATLFDKTSFTDKFNKPTEHQRTRSSDVVASDTLLKLGKVAEASLKVSAGSQFGFGSAIQMSFTSDNQTDLANTVQKIREKLAQGAIPGVINPDISSKIGKPELQLEPDRDKLADANLSVADASAALATLYVGDDTAKMRQNDQEYTVRTMMDLGDRNDPSELLGVPLKFEGGNPILVSDVFRVKEAPALDKVQRRNRIQEIQLTADLLPGNAAGTVQAQITSWITAEKLVPADVQMKPLGQADAQAREMGGMFGALIIGLVLVYMLLASLYDNILYPFIIQLAQPQAMVGALLALVLSNKSFNLVGFIGIVCLVGLVGKNAILLVDFTNTLRGRGRNRHDALAEAGPTRLRPIMMTTLALILGMMPVALALGRGSEFRETIGITIIGGITLSTVLTLVVIPCSYTIFDDLSNWIGGLMGRRGAETVPAPEPADAPTPTANV